MASKDDRSYFRVQTAQTAGKDDDVVKETEDGGAIVQLDDKKPPGENKFYANLAEKMEESELSSIGRTLSEFIERDKESRKKRDEQYEEGIRRTGLGDEAPGGAQFMGASRVVHPMLTEACVDFAARCMKEIFPANGPAKAFIPGDPSDADIERGERLAEYLNYQAIVQIPEMRAELEQMATQLPLGGGQYIKCSWNQKKARPTVLFISIDDVYLPFAASNFYTSERKTHVQYVTQMEFKSRVKSGMYRDIEALPMHMPEFSKSDEASNKVEGREYNSYNEDGLRTIYECFCLYELEDEDEALPYVISIDKSSQTVLSIYRNWDEEDEKRLEMDWIVEFPFIPWRGAYPIGLTHMIGSLAGGATGALRALLDSALINNFPGLLKLKGGMSGGQTERIDPTQVMEIEGAIQDDDVRKLVMPMPFNPPSPVLFELLGFLVDSGKSVIRTSMEEMADTSQDVPVGTTLARLEQGMMVFSAIHGRMHDSMGKLLKILYRVNKFYLEEKEVFDETGKLLIKRQDFDGPMTVVPVSDPNIFSESQRFAQIQLVAQRAQMLPQLYDLRKVEELILERMKIPNVEQLLLPKQEGEETNAVNENIAATLGRPIVAFPEQDHLSHLQTHLEFITNPMLGMSPMIAPKALPILLEHLKEHIVLWYAQRIFDVATKAAGVEINELQRKATAEERKAFDKMLAEASRIVSPEVEGKFQQIPAVMQQCQQLLAQMQPQPQDPAMQLGMAEIQSKEKIEGQKISVEQQKVAQDAQIKQMEFQHAKELENLKGMLKAQEAQFKVQIEQAKLSHQGQIEGAKLSEQSRQADQVMDMEGMKQENENKRTQATLETQILIEQMKEGHAQELEAVKANQQAMLAEQAHGHTKEQKDMDIQSAHTLEDKKQSSAHALEDKKQQSAHMLEDKKGMHAKDMEGMKQSSAHALEDKKQSHAKEIEQFKQGGAVEQKKLDIASAHAMEEDKRSHEMEMQRKADAMQMFSEGGKIAHEKDMKAAEMAHTSYEGDKEREHTSKESEKERKHTAEEGDKDRKATEKSDKDKAKADMDKTKMVETNKVKVADKQLKLKEKEGKEKLEIKKEESKEKMDLQRMEKETLLPFKAQAEQFKAEGVKEKTQLDTQFKKEEHKAKTGLLKTKTKLTEAQLKEKHKIQSQQMKQKAKESSKKPKK